MGFVATANMRSIRTVLRVDVLLYTFKKSTLNRATKRTPGLSCNVAQVQRGRELWAYFITSDSIGDPPHYVNRR